MIHNPWEGNVWRCHHQWLIQDFPGAPTTKGAAGHHLTNLSPKLHTYKVILAQGKRMFYALPPPRSATDHFILFIQFLFLLFFFFEDLKEMKKSNGKFGVEGAPRDDNLFIWVRNTMIFSENNDIQKPPKTVKLCMFSCKFILVTSTTSFWRTG